MVKMIYQVSGWDGDTFAYTSKERALKELERRAGLADRAILVERFEDEREIYLIYEGSFHFFGDDKLYLTLETVPLYE
jgi:hypothetical protein